MIEVKEFLIRDVKAMKGWIEGAEERLTKNNPKELAKIKEKIKGNFKDYDPTGNIYLSDILYEYVNEVSDILDKKLNEAEILYEKSSKHSKDNSSSPEVKENYEKIKYLSSWFEKIFGEEQDYFDYKDKEPKKNFRKIDRAFIEIMNSVDITNKVNLASNYMGPLMKVTGIPLDDYFIIAYSEAWKIKNKIHNFADFLEKYLEYIIVGVLMIFIAPIYNGVGILIDILFLFLFYEVRERAKFLSKVIDYKNYELGKAINELEEKINL